MASLEEILALATERNPDGKYINIHERTHAHATLMTYVHQSAIHLFHSGYTFETALEMGMLWVLDAITLYGIPDDLGELRRNPPTEEELEALRQRDLHEETYEPVEDPNAQPTPPRPPGPAVFRGTPEERAFDKLLGDIDIPDLEEPNATC